MGVSNTYNYLETTDRNFQKKIFAIAAPVNALIKEETARAFEKIGLALSLLAALIIVVEMYYTWKWKKYLPGDLVVLIVGFFGFMFGFCSLIMVRGIKLKKLIQGWLGLIVLALGLSTMVVAILKLYGKLQ